ncbi:MAG: hypothetical protein RL660_3054 [Bacteroidota bacterium]|jgi:hypothetical protein
MRYKYDPYFGRYDVGLDSSTPTFANLYLVLDSAECVDDERVRLYWNFYEKLGSFAVGYFVDSTGAITEVKDKMLINYKQNMLARHYHSFGRGVIKQVGAKQMPALSFIQRLDSILTNPQKYPDAFDYLNFEKYDTVSFYISSSSKF